LVTKKSKGGNHRGPFIKWPEGMLHKIAPGGALGGVQEKEGVGETAESRKHPERRGGFTAQKKKKALNCSLPGRERTSGHSTT